MAASQQRLLLVFGCYEIDFLQPGQVDVRAKHKFPDIGVSHEFPALELLHNHDGLRYSARNRLTGGSSAST